MKPSERTEIREDLAAIFDALYELPPWYIGAALALPDWPEGDPRWALTDELTANRTAEYRLDDLRYAIEQDRLAIVRQHAEAGMSRPLIADALGMSLSELREWMGWP